MRHLIGLLALLLGLHATAWAQGKGVPGKDLYAKDPAEMSAPVLPYSDKPLPELKGVVSWKTLAEVTPIRQQDRFVPQFSKGVAALDKKEIKLQGFMMPLDMGATQQSYRLLCTTFPAGDRAAICNALSLLRGNADAAQKKQAAREALAAFVERVTG